ncbi:MAG: glycosyltransferase, partial [Gemmatimonadota bacterium]
MNILVVAPQPFYEERGTPISTLRLLNALAGLGHAVDILTYPIGREAPDTRATVFRSSGLPGIQHVPIGPSWPKVALDIPLTLKLVRLARPGAYDVVHAVEEAVFPALALAARHRAKVVYDMDSSLAEQLMDAHPVFRLLRRPIRGMEAWALSRSDLVLAVCDDLADQARRAAKSADRVHVLRDVPLEAEPSGEPVDDLRALWPTGTKIALYVGNLVSYQGIDLLLEAVGRLPADCAVGVTMIGGSEGDVAHYRAQTADRGLENRMRFLGRRPVGDLSAYLAQADLLLSPRTKGGNTPLKVYSYMAAGKAILATRITSHTQVLSDQTARLFDPDPASLADALQELAVNRDARERLGAAA